MTVLRIERAVYAVDDLAACSRFFEDFGLEPATHSDTHAEFLTRTGQILELRTIGEATLPPSPESGPGIREIVWGVDTQQALDLLVEDLRRDRDVVVDGEGVAHTHDNTGFGLGLAVAAVKPVEVVPQPRNVTGHVERWNQWLPRPDGRVRPLRICHVAWNIPKAGKEEAVDFYVSRLGFRVTDLVKPMGAFMQAPGDDDQHTALLCWRPDRASTNHTSYEVSSMDEVILGGNQMIEKGWREARRLGRHTVGSNFFRFVHNPAGGRVEYAADMDRVDDSYGPNVHEETPPHHLWTIATNKDGMEA